MNPSMQLMRGFSIRLRMHGAIVMVLALFAMVGLAGLLGGHQLTELNIGFMHHSVEELRAMGDVRHGLGQVRRHEKDMIIRHQDGAAVKKSREAWMAAIGGVQRNFERLLEGDEDADNPIAREALTRLAAYQAGAAKVFDQVQGGTTESSHAVDKLLATAKQDVYQVEKSVEAIVKTLDAEIGQRQQAFNTSMQRTLMSFVAVLVLVVLVVVPLTLMNSRSIIAPMQHARDLALAIAQGDLTRPVDVQGKDEAADLLQALAQMQTALGGLVGEVRQTSESIHGASNEVASGNLDLSGRTELAAGNLQQTAASMQQLTRSVQHSAESSRHASELASSASSVAERGGAVVAQVVSTMDQINHASRRIADIIGTIDGIAFQTNILALNAAVEAARAGEQGRGFAVVAAEVRSLAQRSAAAAREIKSLIGASVDQVDAGTRLVKDAGSTMGDIVVSVQRVKDIIEAITSAASEQSQGIVQINGAVTTLDAMTQQNAALVEESAAAAESLKDQASRLNAVVARFQVHGDGGLPA